jgi:glycosyltransferase involved in cell wall biosynthesis
MTNISDVTAVVINWLSAENTLRAIKSFRKFYPEIKLIIVDDDSNEEDRTEFFSTYNNTCNSPERMYDSGTSKLVDVDKNTTFLQVPRHIHYGKGEGNAMDLAIKNCSTAWLFHFHSDYRFLNGGIIEEMLEKTDDRTCGVGEDKKKHPDLPALAGVVELINVKLGKENNMSFKPVFYADDGRTTPFPDGENIGMPIACGGYYMGRLCQLGYKLVIINDLSSNYGKHLRWEGNEEGWNKYF